MKKNDPEIELTILIPTLNEAKNLRRLIPWLRKVLSRHLDTSEYEILIMDAHSEDDIKNVASKNGARLIQTPRGYGVALAAGFQAARGRYVITMDADFSHSPYIVSNLYASRHRADMIIASRYVKNGFCHTNLSRRFLSFCLNCVYRTLLDIPVKDMSSGFRLYNRGILDEVSPTEKNYVVLQEILMNVYARGFSIAEIPFHYLPRKQGSSKSRLFEFGRDYLFSLFRFWKMRRSVDFADYDERAFRSLFPFQRWWQRRRYVIICGFCRDYHSILDAGCGSSQILDGLPQAVGCDLSLEKLRYKSAPFRKLARADLRRLPFPDGAFEVTILSQTLQHLPDDPAILDEAARVTQKDGFIVIGTPDYATHWKYIHFFYRLFHPRGYSKNYVTKYTRRKLVKEMEKRGFSLKDVKYVFGAEMIARFKRK